MTANPNQNFNLVYAWTVQSNVATGEAGPGYAQTGTVPIQPTTLSAAEQAGSGIPNPVGSENIQGENSGSQAVAILTNPGYSANPALVTPGPVTPPTATPVSGTPYANPWGLSVTVTLSDTTAADLSAVAIAPIGSSTFVTVLAGPGSVTLPVGGQIKLTWASVQPTWTWTLSN